MTPTIPAYFRERFRLAVFVPAILGLAAVALAAAGAWTMTAAAFAVALTSVLVVQFRLWDDLEDRGRDMRTHPERVLVRSAAWPFWLLWLALFLAGALLFERAGRPPAPLAYYTVVAATFIAYRWMRALVSERAWSRWLLLAKYPAFVSTVALAVGRLSPPRLLIAAVVAFVAAQLYERAHTRTELPGAS
jgi:hypothetical protein